MQINNDIITNATWQGTFIDFTHGGTGLSACSQGDLLIGSAANTLTILAKSVLETRYLSNTGINNQPKWDQIDLSNGVVNTLSTNNGGTGFPANWTNGQIPIGITSTGLLAQATLTPDTSTGIVITNGAGSITIGNAQDIRIGASPQFLGLTISGTSNNGILVNSTLAANTSAISVVPTTAFSNASSSMVFLGGILKNTAGSPTDSSYLRINPTFQSVSILTEARGIYIGTGSGSGSSYTNAIWLEIEAPSIGATNSYSIWSKGISAFGSSKQTSIDGSGNFNTTGVVGIGAANSAGVLDVSGSFTSNGAIYGTLLRPNLTETGNGSGTGGVFIGGTHTINGTGSNSAEFLQVAPTVVASSAINMIAGYHGFGPSISGTALSSIVYTMRLDGASVIGAGGATSVYTLGIFAPTIGTNQTALYADNFSCGYIAITPPTNGGIISGAVSIGASSNTYKLDVTGGHIGIMTAGNTLRIKQGSNACCGIGAVMVGGAVTVATTAVATGDLVIPTRTATGGTIGVGMPTVTIINGTSFTLTSSNALDTSTYSWVIIKAA